MIISKLPAAALLLSLLIASSAWEGAAQSCGYAADENGVVFSGSMDIIAGQTNNVGTASYTVVDDGPTFTVEVTMTASAAKGCTFETDQAMDLVPALKTKNKDLAPGRFPLSEKISSATTQTLKYSFPKDGELANCCTPMYLYVHSNVDCPGTGDDTVWAGDKQCAAGTRWCFYEKIEPTCDCDCDAGGTNQCVPKQFCDASDRCPADGMDASFCPSVFEAMCPPKKQCADDDDRKDCIKDSGNAAACTVPELDQICPKKSICENLPMDVCTPVGESGKLCPSQCVPKVDCEDKDKCFPDGTPADTFVCENTCKPKLDCADFSDRCVLDPLRTTGCTSAELDAICPEKVTCDCYPPGQSGLVCPSVCIAKTDCSGPDECFPPGISDSTVCPDQCLQKTTCSGADECLPSGETSVCPGECESKTTCSGAEECLPSGETSVCPGECESKTTCPGAEECLPSGETSVCPGNCVPPEDCEDCEGQSRCPGVPCPTDEATCGGPVDPPPSSCASPRTPPTGCVAAKVACYKCGGSFLDCVVDPSVSETVHAYVTTDILAMTGSGFCKADAPAMTICGQPSCDSTELVVKPYDGSTVPPCPDFAEAKCPVNGDKPGSGVSNFATYTVVTGPDCDSKSITCLDDKCAAENVADCCCSFCSGSCNSRR